MIKIEKNLDLLNQCNSCGLEDNNITLIFCYKNNTGGSAITLCENCQKDLIKKLKELNNENM